MILKGIDQETDRAFQMERERNLGLREKALSLVHSEDIKEKGWFQNFHTVKLGEWQCKRLYKRTGLKLCTRASPLFVTQKCLLV